MPEITLWGTGTSRTFRVHWLLAELDLPYSNRAMNPRTGERLTESFTALNPKQKIPVLTYDQTVISESFAILRFLRRQCEALPLSDYQKSLEGQTRFDELSSFILMELDATSLYIVRRHQDLSKIYGEAPNAVASARAYFLRLLNSGISDFDPTRFVWGELFSELDILLVSTLDWADAMEIPLPAAFQQYLEYQRQRPAYLAAKQANRPNQSQKRPS